MKVFVTGATGFIGSAVVEELISAGHQVIGLTRSDVGAKSLTAAGAQVHRGDLVASKPCAAEQRRDAVIHTAFVHDFSRFQENCETDRRAIEALGDALVGSDRPLIVTSGLVLMAEGRLATEDDKPVPPSPSYPRASEVTAAVLAENGVNTSVVRPPQVHDTVKQGLVTYAIGIAREKGMSAYIADGRNRWAAVHLPEAARLYRLALENAKPGARYHAVAEEGVFVRDIAEVIGRGLNAPVRSISAEEAAAHFGGLAGFVGLDLAASSAQTRKQLGWNATGPGLIADLENMRYFETDAGVPSAAPVTAAG